jgi:hypothetical protein
VLIEHVKWGFSSSFCFVVVVCLFHLGLPPLLYRINPLPTPFHAHSELARPQFRVVGSTFSIFPIAMVFPSSRNVSLPN